MAEPLTDEQLSEMRKIVDAATIPENVYTREAQTEYLRLLELCHAAMPLLLDEVERLKTERQSDG